MTKEVNENQKKLIIVIVLNIFALLGWLFFLYTINAAKMDFNENVSLLQQEFNKGQSSQALRHLLRETDEDRQKLESYFVNDESIISFLGSIESLESTVGVSLDLVSFQEVENGLELNFQANGTFPKIYKFIELVELLPYELKIGFMEMRKDVGFDQSTQTAQSIWEGSFTLVLHSFISSN